TLTLSKPICPVGAGLEALPACRIIVSLHGWGLAGRIVQVTPVYK
ncbi:MAG: hypothetical protein ACJATG_002038, partial [Dinoroseobacter sp.]